MKNIRASFSSYNDKVDIAAPGDDIVSTDNNLKCGLKPSSKIGRDHLGFTAGLTGNAAMTSFRSPVPHPFNRPDVVSSRTPLETSAGQKVTIGRGGKARSAMDKKRKPAADIVDGTARAISPTNEEEGLNLLEAGIDRKREEIRASKAKEVAAAVAVEREREREVASRRGGGGIT
mmetsp:Transcript_26930/g.59832  ORF Transcript_26930/g.59832 Transcript_26930/m.59832 type:complete len:175 (-) Transcript_26930:1543-2067(-)